MSDFPTSLGWVGAGTITHMTSLAGAVIALNRASATSATYIAANRALFIPFLVGSPITVYQIGWRNGTTVSNAANDMDVGIYDELGNRLVSQGGTITQTPVSTLQLSNITDTALNPGLYFMAIVASNTTGHFFRSSTPAIGLLQAGVQQQASALPLPATATFANVSGAYLPAMCVTFNATT